MHYFYDNKLSFVEQEKIIQDYLMYTFSLSALATTFLPLSINVLLSIIMFLYGYYFQFQLVYFPLLFLIMAHLIKCFATLKTNLKTLDPTGHALIGIIWFVFVAYIKNNFILSDVSLFMYIINIAVGLSIGIMSIIYGINSGKIRTIMS